MTSPADVDPIKPARGCLLGLVIGAAMWAAAYLVWR